MSIGIPYRSMVAALAAIVILPTGGTLQAAEKKLSLQVYRADENSFFVGSVIVSGTNEAVLIDGQFTLADAHRVVAQLLASGKKLSTVFVSHHDPDYYFGLEVIAQAFPDAKIVASAKTVENIRNNLQKKLEFWGPKLGANGPKRPPIPEVMTGNVITLEGETIEVVVPDAALPAHTYLWIPSLKAVVGGTLVFSDLHVWTADTPKPEQRKAWVAALDKILALKPEIVVPGHSKSATLQKIDAVRFTRDYLVAFEQELPKAKDAAALIAVMTKKFPKAGLSLSIELGAKVAKGEMTW